MNILVVDHSKVFRTLWDRATLRLGHQTLSASSGEEGLATLRTRHVDLVCVSLTLPDMDGTEFCRQLRTEPRHKNIPVIALSSTEDKQARLRCFEAGVTEIYSKTDMDALTAQVERLSKKSTKNITGRVLYVEDSSVVAHVMTKIIKGMALDVDHYKSADEAFEAFQNFNYDVIISDIIVEGKMSGMGLVNRIRELPDEKSRVPILAISGMDDSARRIELFRIGVNDFITKPVIKEEVVARITNLITSKQLFDQVKAQQKHLYELAMVDPLTGLYNRNSLNEFANKYFGEAARHDLPLSLMVIDLDEFKKLNDSYGHLAGDTALEKVGALLKANCRQEDFPARYGGDEFLIILTHCDMKAACEKARYLLAEIEKLKPEGVAITASIGVAARARGERSKLDELLKQADDAVYEAKKRGRNQVICAKE